MSLGQSRASRGGTAFQEADDDAAGPSTAASVAPKKRKALADISNSQRAASEDVPTASDKIAIKIKYYEANNKSRPLDIADAEVMIDNISKASIIGLIMTKVEDCPDIDSDRSRASHANGALCRR